MFIFQLIVHHPLPLTDFFYFIFFFLLKYHSFSQVISNRLLYTNKKRLSWV